MSRIGVMGGTFDPIHYGHLVTAEAARVEFGLDSVLFVPAGRPPHKESARITPAQHRYTMTVLATLTNPHFDVSRVDIDRPGLTYTVDTLTDLKAQYGPETELFFITGADAIQEIISWKDSERLLELCQFIGATRPGYSLEELEKRLGGLYERYRNRFYFLEVPALAISSSDIRKRVRASRPVRYLLPETVAYYILKNRLYQENGGQGDMK